MSTDQALPDVPEEEPAEEPFPEISYDQQRYAARPERLRPKAKRKLAGTDTSPLSPPFTPDGRNPAYVDWLERQSMPVSYTHLTVRCRHFSAASTSSWPHQVGWRT